MSLTHRENTIFSTDTQGKLTLASGSIIAYAPGGVVASDSTGSTITLYGGHGFVGGEKFMVGIDPATISGIYTIGSVVGNVLTINLGGSATVVAGDRLVNLGSDSGTTGPNYDGSTATIYSTPDTTVVIDDSRIVLDEGGGYEYWHQGLALWEVVFGGDGSPIGINEDCGIQTLATTTLEDLVADDVTVETLTATTATIATLDATAATIEDLTVADTLGVTGATTLTNATISGTLGVTGVTTLTGALHADGNVINTANTSVQALTVAGALTAQEAINEAAIGTLTGTHGQTFVRGFSEEEVTLSTGGVTSDSVGNLLPAGSLILAVVGRVTTTITTATDWALGITGAGTRFASANATMTSGSTSIGINQWSGTVAIAQAAAAKVRITTTGTPGAGKIRVGVFYLQFTAPTS